MKYYYIEKQLIDEDGDTYITYAVSVKLEGKIIEYVPDVFLKEKDAKYYVNLFNELKLSLVHLYDVLEDIL